MPPPRSPHGLPAHALLIRSAHLLLQEDVDSIAQEMELDKDVAERKLREHNGDAVQTLMTLVSA